MRSEPPRAGVAPGDVLAGKYRVESVLGEGGMGVVVAAHHIQLDEKVALKFLHRDALKNPEALDRFAREARAAAKIKSEHVARVIDVGVLDNGAPYMVMEYLQGSDLGTWRERHGPMPIERAVQLVLQACEALAEAHALGIIHRDLKPSNLFLADRRNGDPIVKVLDFGISKSMTASMPQLTKSSAVVGSPLYMSPEQMQSAKNVDGRSDVWSLGVTLYELVGGNLPFVADTMPQLILHILQREPEPLSSLCPSVPIEFEAVVHRCLKKDPAERYASVRSLAEALAPFGPAECTVSLSRIAHVLGTPRPAGQAVIVASGGPAPSPDATTLGLEESLETAATQVASAATGARTTQPVASDGSAHAGGRLRWSFMVAGLALLLAGLVGWRFGAISSPATPATPPALVPSAPVAVAEPRVGAHSPVAAASAPASNKLAVFPVTASVEVDGKPVPLSDGVVEVPGKVGSPHSVRVIAGGKRSEFLVILGEEGPVPASVELTPTSPAPGGVPTPRKAPAASASAVPSSSSRAGEARQME